MRIIFYLSYYVGDVMNYETVKSVYRVVGDEVFDRICLPNKNHKKRKPTKPEIMEGVIDCIKSNRKILLTDIVERLGFSRSSIQACLRSLFYRKMVRKEINRKLSGQPVTYVWVGEK